MPGTDIQRQTLILMCLDRFLYLRFAEFPHTYIHTQPCMSAYIHVYLISYSNVCMHLYKYTFMHTNSFVCTQSCMTAYIHSCLLHSYIHTIMHVSTYNHTYVHANICTFIHGDSCMAKRDMHRQMLIHVCLHTCVYTYIHVVHTEGW